jgi:hypothetical protein
MEIYYQRNGKPYEGTDDEKRMKFARDFEGDRFVGRDTLITGVYVSTVWLGIDHNFGHGKPLIFESMVFPAWRRGEYDQLRYHTEEEALEGHNMLVRKWSWLQFFPWLRKWVV